MFEIIYFTCNRSITESRIVIDVISESMKFEGSWVMGHGLWVMGHEQNVTHPDFNFSTFSDVLFSTMSH